MKKKILYLGLLIIGLVLFKNANAQSTCAPVLTYNNNFDLCAGTGDLTLTVSVGLPPGCVYANTLTPFLFIGPGAPGAIDDNFTTITNASAGNYSVQVSIVQSGVPGAAICPCVATYTSNVITVNPIPNMPNVTSTNISCGGSTVLTAVAPVGSVGGYFNWYDDNSNLVFTGNNFHTGPLNVSTNYSVSYVKGNCESLLNSFSIIVNQVAQPVGILDTVKVNCNNNVTLTGQAPSSGVLHWYEDINLSVLLHIGNQYTTPNLNSSKTYYVTNVVGSCESAWEKVLVEVFETPAPVVNLVSSCKGEELILTASHGSSGLGSGVFEWYDGNNVFLYSGTQFNLFSQYTSVASAYNLYVLENINGCKSTLSSQTIEILPSPDINLAETFVQKCQSDSFRIIVSSSFDPNTTFYWKTPWDTIISGNQLFIPKADKNLNEGIYYVYAQSTLTGCKSEEISAQVQIISSPNLGILPMYEIMDGDQLQLDVSGADQFEWFPTEYVNNSTISNPIFQYEGLKGKEEEIVSLKVIGKDYELQCKTIDSTLIRIKPYVGNSREELPIIVYNIITPNGDGDNDYWFIDYLYNIGDYVISVFDDRNHLIYYMEGSGDDYIKNPWNGKVDNDVHSSVSTSTYRYSIQSISLKKAVIGYVSVFSN